MKNVIITSSNEKIGDFLIDHWLKSLKENVNLKNTDIVVIDYGLSDSQKNRLKKEKVILFKGNEKYHIVNKRFFDAADFLKKNFYDQILFVDGGDIIFQEDISAIFKKNKKIFRVVSLGSKILFFKIYIDFYQSVDEKIKQEIWKTVKNKPIINAGVIFAPTDKFIEMGDLMKKIIINKDMFGVDQIIVNYYLYKNKNYKFLNSKYNFMMATEKKGFLVKKGIFYKKNGEKIAIVHNSGQINFFRPIDNFGYQTKNKLKNFIYHIKKIFYKLLEIYKQSFSN